MNERRMSMTLDIGADISKVKIAAQELQNLFKNTSLDPFKTKNLQNMFNGLNDALADLEKRSGKALSSLGEGRGVDASKKRVLSYIQNITQEFQELEGLGDTQLSKKIKGLSDSLEQSSKAFDRYEASMKSTKDQAKDLGKQLETLQDIQKKQERLAEIEKDLPNKRRQATRTSNEFGVVAKNLSIAQGNKTRTENRYKKYIEENSIQLTQKGIPKVLANQKDGITQEQIDKANQLYEAYDKAAKAYAELNKDAQNKQDKKNTAAKELTDLENEQKTLKTSLEGVNDTLEETKNKVNQTQEAIKSFNQEGRDTASFEELKKTLKGLFGDEIVKDIDNTKEGIQTLKDRIENISTDRVKELRKLFPELFNSIKGLSDSAQTMGKKVDEGLSQFSRANEASQEISHLASRLKYFFSLAGGFQLMRRAIRSATETTKELDAVMTQTAVVSKFTVGDMWKTLPEYSKYAKQLGTAIKDVYSAQTLYVQQGLSMDKAMDIGIETLKMARVANIDAAEATNSMTAALRGFNMELNETSAQRINDVYSKLAQNTASNTQEISTAMTKTAALANSANMSFENTAAFLATIIESTREGAETAGTALKTVIARFTEVKKLYSEGELLGTDEEGQEVDVNKISAALRTAGINMNDFFTGAKGLDEIFLELGSKWNSLSTVQQRYIATMAAGSRQQSRFLALMQNYNRTVELTQMAYNSAGSGQEQFEKTLDSLQAKIEKFKAEWQTFIMGIANSDAIKGIIDAGTKILEIINKIIDGISGGNGLVKSIASIVTAVGIFKGGRSLTKMIMGGAGNYGLGGIIGNWLGVKNGYGEKQEQATAFKASMRERGRRTEYLHTSWFGQGGVLNPKGRVANNELIPQAEADAKAKYEAYKAALEKQKIAAQDYEDSRGGKLEAQARVNLTNANEDVRQTQAEYGESQKSLDNIKSSATDAGTAMYQYGQAAKTAGMAAGVAAGACMLLATVLDKTGNTKAAKTLRGIGTVLTVLSGVFMVLGQVAQITGAQIAAGAKTASTAIMNIPIIGWIAAIIAALIALGIAISNFVETDAEKAQRLAAETENAKQVAEQASQAYDDLLSAKSGYDELVSQLEGLTKGTIEYKNALYEANQQVLELAKNYKDLEYTYDPKTGSLKISEESWNKIQERELNRKQSTSAIANLTENRENREKTRQNLDQLKSFYRLNKTFGYSEHNPLNGRTDKGQIHTTLIEGLTDKEILALDKLGYTTTDLQKMYAEATNSKGKTYSELTYNMNSASKQDIEEIQASYTSSLKKALFATASIIEDPYKELDTNLQNSLYAMSDQTKKSSYVLSKLYNSETFKNIPTVTPGSGRTDWKERDWRQTARDINGNIIKDAQGNNKRYWDDIIDTVLEEGLLSETEATSLKSTRVNSNEANKKLYAAITGQNYSDVKDKDIQEVVNYIADYYTSSKMAEQFGIDQKEFEKLNPKVQDAFIELSEAPNNLTLEQIKTLKEAWSDIGKIGFDTEILKEYQGTLTDLGSNLGFKTEGIEFGKYLSKNLQNQRKELDQWFNSEFLGQYDDLLNDIVTSNNFTETQKGSIVNLLSNTNIKSLDDLYKVIDNLKEAGIDLEAQDNNVYNSLISFAKALGNAGIATKKWSQENAKEAIKNARGIANDKKESQDRKFTKEEFATISELFRGTEYDNELKYFMEQTDGSYKYVGPYLDTIINALYVIANKIPSEQIGSVGGKVDLANKIAGINISDELKENAKNRTQEAQKELRRAAWEYSRASALYNSTIDSPTVDRRAKSTFGQKKYYAQEKYNNAKQQYEEALRYQNTLQITGKTEKEINDLYTNDSDKAKFYNDAIKTFIDQGINDEDLLKAGLTKEVDASTVGAVWQTLLDILFNPEALEGEAETLRQQIEVNSLIGQNNMGELSMVAKGLGKYSEYDETTKKLANSTIQTELETTGEAEATFRRWMEYDETLDETDSLYKVLAIDSANYTKNIKEMGQALKDPIEKFKEAKKKGEDLDESLQEIRNTLKKFYGSNFNISNKEIIEKMPLLEKMEKGGKEADAAGREFGKDYAQGVYDGLNKEFEGEWGNELKNAVQQAQDAYDSGNFQPIEITIPITGNVDGTALYESLNGATSGLAAYAGTLLKIELAEDEESIRVVGNYKGFGDFGGAKSGGGGGGGKKEFKNDFDKYYNMVEDINELERLRNLLETDYEQLLKSEAISGKAIYDNLKKQIQLLKERRDITADLAEKRKGQIFETMDDKQYASVRKYAWWNDTDQTIEIDWDAINKVKDSEQGDLIKEYVSKLEGFQSQYDEQIEALEDIETTLQEIQKRGQEEYTSLEDRTRDALIKQIQDKIDELTAVDEAINDTNQKLMDSIQRELEKQRQERENAKTEEELADKEQRLAYLQQDSSGANALEIAKLQEELADARENYTDSLIDQKITELQEQNDEAAQQRQEQIDLMQQSLDWQEKSGAFWEQVYEYIQAGTDEVGTLVHGSELENLLKAGEAWDSLSEEGQMKWLEELENQVAQAIGYLSLSRQLEEIGTKEGTKITFTDAEGNTHTGTADKNGNVVVKNADGSTTTWKDVYQSYDGSYQTLETRENAQTTPKPATNSGKPSNSSGNNSSNNGTPDNTPPLGKKYKIVHDTVWWHVEERSDGNYENETTAKNEAKNHNEKLLKQYQIEIKELQKQLIDMNNGIIPYTVDQRNELLRKIKGRYDLIRYKETKGYKTGGLADYTGPAWLDGTPSKPELVLNARDTENFIQLKDHLAALRQAGTLNAGGDNYYDIDVHVDSLGSDYDVDMAIDRIKTRLYQDGAYRNVNTLNRLR